MAGALTAVVVPSVPFEAARDLARTREQVRTDLMRCRHRLSKLLLRHGRVWDRGTWTKVHREWLSAQTFAQTNTELAFIDNLAACDGLVARKQALDERLSWIALHPPASSPASCGPPRRSIAQTDSPPGRVREAPAPKSAGTREATMGSPNQATPASRHAFAGDATRDLG
jgi:hypothetical protein